MGRRCDEGKVRYTHAEATKVIIAWNWALWKREMKGLTVKKPAPTRAYRCPYCGQHHITQQPKKGNG